MTACGGSSAGVEATTTTTDASARPAEPCRFRPIEPSPPTLAELRRALELQLRAVSGAVVGDDGTVVRLSLPPGCEAYVIDVTAAFPGRVDAVIADPPKLAG